VKVSQRSGSDNLEFQVFLHQQDQDSTIRSNELFREVVPRQGREVHPDRMYWAARQVERLFVRRNPREDLFPGG
jgi:hypothetical protein